MIQTIKINAEIKILFSIFMSILVFYIKGLVSLCVVSSITILSLIIFKTSFKICVQNNKYIISAGFIFMVFGWCTSGFSILLLKSLSLAFFRLMNLVFVGTAITSGTASGEISEALRKFLKPLEFLGLNSKEIAMTVVLSLRFFDILKREWVKIVKAQKARCAGNDGFNLKKIIKRYIKLLKVFFRLSLKKSNLIAQAMESRGFSL